MLESIFLAFITDTRKDLHLCKLFLELGYNAVLLQRLNLKQELSLVTWLEEDG